MPLKTSLFILLNTILSKGLHTSAFNFDFNSYHFEISMFFSASTVLYILSNIFYTFILYLKKSLNHPGNLDNLAELTNYFNTHRREIIHRIIPLKTPTSLGLVLSSRVRSVPYSSVGHFDGTRPPTIGSGLSCEEVTNDDVIDCVTPLVRSFYMIRPEEDVKTRTPQRPGRTWQICMQFGQEEG